VLKRSCCTRRHARAPAFGGRTRGTRKATNEIEDGEELAGSYATKEVAVSAGREELIDRKTEHVIHNEDGTIRERNSYGI